MNNITSRLSGSLLLLLVIAAVAGRAAAEETSLRTLLRSSCGGLGVNLKVINGQQCKNTSSSPVVRIISKFRVGPAGYCTGTLISPTHVLTAGHCAQDINNPTDTRLQSVILTTDGESIDVVSAEIMPGFQVRWPHIYNDAAVMTLSRPLHLPTVPVLTSFVPPAKSKVRVFGYGRTVTGTPPHWSFDELLQQPLDLRTGTMSLAQVTATHYRAPVAVAGHTTLCHGDSGGPLLYNYNGQLMIIGVTSQVVANNTTIHCAPGAYAEWTKLAVPALKSELLKAAPDMDMR